jgi:1-acyl-sn-glycerol-3-phosphate acyltransferase
MWALLLCLTAAIVLLFRWWRSSWPFFAFLVYRVVSVYAKLWHRWSSNGPAPLPAKGSAILIANHTCSADPSFLTTGSPRILSFLIASEYYRFRWLIGLFEYMRSIPVKRDGLDVTALRLSLRQLSEGRVLCIFPEGGLFNAGRTEPGPGKPGVALLALKSRAPVYPALIRGGHCTRDVLTAWFCPSPVPVRVTFGPPVDLSPYYDRPMDRQLLEEVTAFLMQSIMDLRYLDHKISRGGSHESAPKALRAV